MRRGIGALRQTRHRLLHDEEALRGTGRPAAVQLLALPCELCRRRPLQQVLAAAVSHKEAPKRCWREVIDEVQAARAAYQSSGPIVPRAIGFRWPPAALAAASCCCAGKRLSVPPLLQTLNPKQGLSMPCCDPGIASEPRCRAAILRVPAGGVGDIQGKAAARQLCRLVAGTAVSPTAASCGGPSQMLSRQPLVSRRAELTSFSYRHLAPRVAMLYYGSSP